MKFYYFICTIQGRIQTFFKVGGWAGWGEKLGKLHVYFVYCTILWSCLNINIDYISSYHTISPFFIPFDVLCNITFSFFLKLKGGWKLSPPPSGSTNVSIDQKAYKKKSRCKQTKHIYWPTLWSLVWHDRAARLRTPMYKQRKISLRKTIQF